MFFLLLLILLLTLNSSMRANMTQSASEHQVLDIPKFLPGQQLSSAAIPPRGGELGGELLKGGQPHLWAAVLASSTPPPCIQLRTFIPPSGSSFRLLPLLWMLSWIPNMNKSPPGSAPRRVRSLGLSFSPH